jgi:hypothetical protein
MRSKIVYFLSLGLLSASVHIYAQQNEIQQQGTAPTMTPAQKLVANTGEDLLTGNNGEDAQTVISGYGQASFQRNNKYQDNQINLDRIVLFVGHQFNKRIALFTELEVEDAKIEGGKPMGTIGMEQAYLKFSINPRQYFVAGLFLPRIGILNENHLPVNFNGVERPLVEQFIIPSTWRELGIGFYSQLSNLPLSYSIGVVNGLDAGGFEHGTGFMGGRREGQMASANNIAITAAVNAYVSNFKFQISGYAGGTVPLSKYEADSLQTISGFFAAPLYLGEADIQYYVDGFAAKLLGVYASYPEAGEINSLYANNSPQSMFGAYAELSYNIFESIAGSGLEGKQLLAFVRYERLNMNASIPLNGITDGTLDQSHVIFGLNYMPLPNVTVKADMRLTHTGPQNKALLINPPPVMLPYPQQNSFINLGIGYSF